MATKRSNQSWVAPRSGGYSAKNPASSRSQSADTGRFRKTAPPSGPGAASDTRNGRDSSDK